MKKHKIMKTTNWIIGLMLLLFTFSLHGQNQPTQQQSQSTDQNVGEGENIQNEQQGNDDANRQRGTGDTPGAAEAAAAAANNGDADSTAQVSNAPAIPQTTESSSGSPAVLAEDDGEARDGTNTVQRASMNMAGSPVNNLNLTEGQAVDPDTEMADRQDRTQEKQVSAQMRGEGGNTVSESGDMNNNTRRENNALSDQDVSSKDKKSQSSEDEEKKGKQKRKKDRG